MLSSPSSTNASKRKAGDEMTSPPVRRLRLSAPESSLPPDPPPTGRKTAEPDSIHAILQDHCRTRLYVPPVAWTETQLQLLECQFDQKFSTKKEKPVQPAPQRSGCPKNGQTTADSSTQNQPMTLQFSETMSRAANELRSRSTIEAKEFDMKRLLKAYDIHPFDQAHLSSLDRLDFYFSNRPVATIQTDGVFSKDSTAPNLAFISFHTINLCRERHINRLLSRNRSNVPVNRIRLKKLDALTPPNKLEDPYIVSILIALAQAQRHQQEQQSQQQAPERHHGTILTTSQIDQTGSNTILSVGESRTACVSSSSKEHIRKSIINSFKVQVLVLPDIPANSLYLYNANIPSEFIDKFDQPWKFSRSSPIEIKYCRIDMASGTRLRKLHRLLCPGSCSCCTPYNIERDL